jgi:hypothetical protein
MNFLQIVIDHPGRPPKVHAAPRQLLRRQGNRMLAALPAHTPLREQSFEAHPTLTAGERWSFKPKLLLKPAPKRRQEIAPPPAYRLPAARLATAAMTLANRPGARPSKKMQKQTDDDGWARVPPVRVKL